MPDLLHVVELINLLVEVGAWELVWPWPQVVHLLICVVHEVSIVGLLMVMAMEVASLGMGSFLLLIDD